MIELANFWFQQAEGQPWRRGLVPEMTRRATSNMQQITFCGWIWSSELTNRMFSFPDPEFVHSHSIY
jgi:hypothetical protein